MENNLNTWELLKETDEVISSTLGDFIFDTIAKVNLSDDNAITHVYFPDTLEANIKTAIANPKVPTWVLEQYPNEDPNGILEDFTKVLNSGIVFTAVPEDSFVSEEPHSLQKWIKFDSKNEREKRFLLNFANNFGVLDYFKGNAPELSLTLTDIKGMYMHYALMECMSNKMIESQAGLQENRSGFSALGE